MQPGDRVRLVHYNGDELPETLYVGQLGTIGDRSQDGVIEVFWDAGQTLEMYPGLGDRLKLVAGKGCPNCGSTELSTSISPAIRHASGAQNGRLTLSDIAVVEVTGCDTCSETVSQAVIS